MQDSLEEVQRQMMGQMSNVYPLDYTFEVCHRRTPAVTSSTLNTIRTGEPCLLAQADWASTCWVLNKWLPSVWVSKDCTLICLLNCVGNFSSSTSFTAALPRNKSMVMPGGSNPWCCCHFSAYEKGNAQ